MEKEKKADSVNPGPMEMRTPQEPVFRTKDFWLAAALTASACRILRLDWNGPSAHFVFYDGLHCEALSDGYWAGTLKVPARAMTDALRTLKDRLHQGAKTNGDESKSASAWHNRRTMEKEKLEFLKAFNKCQGLLTPVKADSVNPHFKNKYASLEAVLGAVSPFIEAGFVFLQGGVDIGGKSYLRTKLIHSAGHEEIFDYPLISDDNPQHLAGASTYARRYSICALVGLCVDDDDGNTAAGNTVPGKAYVPSDAPKRTTEAAPQPSSDIEYATFVPTDVQMVPGRGKGAGKTFSEIYNGRIKYGGDELQGQMALSALEAKKEISVGFARNGEYLNIKRGCVKMVPEAAKEEADVPF